MSEKEKEFYLEKLIPGKEIKPVEFEDPELAVKVDKYIFGYAPFESRFNPTFSGLSKEEKVEIDQPLVEWIMERVENVKESQREIVKLGKPKEQIRLDQEGQSITISNYFQSLTPEQLEEITRWFDTMNSVSNDKFSRIRNIIILPGKGEKLPTGEPLSGKFKEVAGGIVLYAPVFAQKEHRTGGVSHLTGTLTHEYFHQYNRSGGTTKLSQEWNKIGGWKPHFKYPEEIKGKREITDFEHLVETEYGRTASAEEFCEAAVKAIYNRRGFKDPKKLDFFDRNFLSFKDIGTPKRTNVTKIKDPQLPELPREFTFTMVKAE